MRRRAFVITISTHLVNGTRPCQYNAAAHSIGLHHVSPTHPSLLVDQTASAENTGAMLRSSNMLIPRRSVPSPALSECGESCRPATNSIGEVIGTVCHCERESIVVDPPADHSTLEVSSSDYSDPLDPYCQDAVTQPKADRQSNTLEDLESSSTTGSVILGKKEWIPTMLGKWPVFSLVLMLFFLVGLLEYFDRLSTER